MSAACTFTHAIVRPPGVTFAAGLTTAGLGAPDLGRALAQHAVVVAALRACGLEVLVLPPADAFPDATFVEDAALLAPGLAVATRPGAESRRGEVAALRPVLTRIATRVCTIDAPGTLDAGDVCMTDEGFLVGVSARTNEDGARQLARHLADAGHAAELVDVRDVRGALHLKSALAYLGAGRVLVQEALAAHPALARFERVRVARDDDYAANVVRIGERVLVPAGHPRVEAALRALDLEPLALDVSEFRKMDGGLSCLSLRYDAATLSSTT